MKLTAARSFNKPHPPFPFPLSPPSAPQDQILRDYADIERQLTDAKNAVNRSRQQEALERRDAEAARKEAGDSKKEADGLRRALAEAEAKLKVKLVENEALSKAAAEALSKAAAATHEAALVGGQLKDLQVKFATDVAELAGAFNKPVPVGYEFLKEKKKQKEDEDVPPSQSY